MKLKYFASIYLGGDGQDDPASDSDDYSEDSDAEVD